MFCEEEGAYFINRVDFSSFRELGDVCEYGEFFLGFF